MKKLNSFISTLLFSSALLTPQVDAQTISAPTPHNGYYQVFTSSGSGVLPNYCAIIEVTLIGGGASGAGGTAITSGTSGSGGGGGTGVVAGGTGGAGGNGAAAVMCD